MPHSRRLLWSMSNEGGKFVYKSVSGVFEVNPNITGKLGGGGGLSERVLRVLCSLTMAEQRNREREKGKVRERFCD